MANPVWVVFFVFFNGMNCFGIRREEKESRRRKKLTVCGKTKAKGEGEEGVFGEAPGRTLCLMCGGMTY